MTLDEVDAILSSPATRLPYVRLMEKGKPTDPQEFTFDANVARHQVKGLLNHELVMKAFCRGSTIVLDSVQHWLPAVQDLLRSLQEELGADGRATVFASPPREQALEPHADSYEIFVLQMAGSKEWALYSRLDPVPRAGVRLNRDELSPERETIVLNPGDLLYLPWGTPHEVRSLDAASVHITLAVRPPTWGEILHRLLQLAINDGREHEPALMHRGGEEELGKELAARLSRITASIGEVSPPALADRLIAEATERSQPSAGLTLASVCRKDEEANV
ncbi:JmjC domain-containing protein [Streptomyces sp. IPPR8]|uniref:JmjC domain-containing protein n=1 Tax=unclassified Streptomyces TaxID=2593676 RepID=UPI0027E19470|nr:cupin domain-containing protein [Streptomyces sp. DH1]